MQKPRIAFYTLGCKVNQYDTAVLEAAFSAAGYQLVDVKDAAEAYVVNSCSVTARSEAKARQAVRRLRRLHPRAIMALIGCYVQANLPSAAELDQADILLGTGAPQAVVDAVETALGRKEKAQAPVGPPAPRLVAARGRTRAQLKIQDGCDAFCTYCIVPFARGPLCSRPVQEIVEEAAALREAGYQEIVISGVRLGAYGGDSGDGDLAELIVRLDQLGDYRLRFSSIEPEDVTLNLIAAMANSSVLCPHLHLPLQSGADEVLRRMGRRYTQDDYRQLLGRLRNALPQLAVSTDIMVGFPGESVSDFNISCDFVEEMAFSRLHVFRYSPRPQTAAAAFADQLPALIKRERSVTMLTLGDRLALHYHQRYLNTSVEVLVEDGDTDDVLHGFTPDYVRVFFAGPDELCNRLACIEVSEATARGLLGQLRPPKEGDNDEAPCDRVERG